MPLQETGLTTNNSTPMIAVVTLAERGDDSAANRKFWHEVDAVRASLGQQPGLVAWSIRRELLGKRAWTLTIWKDQQSISDFKGGAIHQKAMANGSGALRDMRFARFEVAPEEMPISWSTALTELERHGR